MTTNPYYQASGNPGTRTVGLSQLVRTEFLSIQAGFDRLLQATGNRLHNAGFRVNQRAFTTGTALAAGDYGPDRWKAGAGGCTYIRLNVGGANIFQIQITAGTLVQIIEAQDLEGGSYVLSWSGTAQAQINGGGFSSSPLAVTGITVNTNLTVEFSTGFLSQPQFQAGTVAGAFDWCPVALDEIKCQRFFLSANIQAAAYAAGAGSVQGAFYPFPTIMRAAPSITLSSLSYANGSAGIIINSGRAGLLPGWTATGAGATTFTANSFTASADL